MVLGLGKNNEDFVKEGAVLYIRRVDNYVIQPMPLTQGVCVSTYALRLDACNSEMEVRFSVCGEAGKTSVSLSILPHSVTDISADELKKMALPQWARRLFLGGSRLERFVFAAVYSVELRNFVPTWVLRNVAVR